MKNITEWINLNTQGYQCTVEFGAMYGDKVASAATEKKIALEIHEPYIKSIPPSVLVKQCDFRGYEAHVDPADRDVALFVDTLEHVTKEDGLSLMARVQREFNRVLLMVPEGDCPQEGHSGNPYQAHLSTWGLADVSEMGFQQVEHFPHFHGEDKGCVFAVWTKSNT